MPKAGRLVPTDIHACFCHNLASLRAMKEWSQKELGERCKPPISREMVSDMERGRFVPTIDLVEKISRAFRLPWGVLLDENMAENMKPIVKQFKEVWEEIEYPAKKMYEQKQIIKFARRKA